MDRVFAGAILLIVGGPAGWWLGAFWKEPAMVIMACGTVILIKCMLA
jgi:hypothetical protein